jgi:hypothetical protein
MTYYVVFPDFHFGTIIIFYHVPFLKRDVVYRWYGNPITSMNRNVQPSNESIRAKQMPSSSSVIGQPLLRPGWRQVFQFITVLLYRDCTAVPYA